MNRRRGNHEPVSTLRRKYWPLTILLSLASNSIQFILFLDRMHDLQAIVNQYLCTRIGLYSNSCVERKEYWTYIVVVPKREEEKDHKRKIGKVHYGAGES